MTNETTTAGHSDAKLPAVRTQALQGVAYASVIFIAWTVTLVVGFAPEYAFTAWSAAALLGVIALRTFLSTGLFIVAHDAIHGTIAPGRPRLNGAIGRMAAFIYAFFPFRKLAGHHRSHHAHPGTDHDPDFHRSGHPQFFKWYVSFITRYADWRQFVGFALVYNLLAHVFGFAEYKIWLVWIVPTLLSTLQLFYFGTYLPHRAKGAAFCDQHRARSSTYPRWVSFLTCYHFGYHLEHHRHPEVPWWLLPRAQWDSDRELDEQDLTSRP